MSEAATLPNVKVKKRREIQKLSLWDVLFFLSGSSSEIFDLILRPADDIASLGFMVRWGLISQSAAESTCFFPCVTRGFSCFEGGGDSLFSATQVEPSLEKEKLAAIQKKVKIKRSLKKWVMEKPWNLTRQISSIKKLLGILVFEEKPSSARRTLSI